MQRRRSPTAFRSPTRFRSEGASQKRSARSRSRSPHRLLARRSSALRSASQRRSRPGSARARSAGIKPPVQRQRSPLARSSPLRSSLKSAARAVMAQPAPAESARISAILPARCASPAPRLRPTLVRPLVPEPAIERPCEHGAAAAPSSGSSSRFSRRHRARYLRCDGSLCRHPARSG